MPTEHPEKKGQKEGNTNPPSSTAKALALLARLGVLVGSPFVEIVKNRTVSLLSDQESSTPTVLTVMDVGTQVALDYTSSAVVFQRVGTLRKAIADAPSASHAIFHDPAAKSAATDLLFAAGYATLYLPFLPSFATAMAQSLGGNPDQSKGSAELFWCTMLWYMNFAFGCLLASGVRATGEQLVRPVVNVAMSLFSCDGLDRQQTTLPFTNAGNAKQLDDVKEKAACTMM